MTTATLAAPQRSVPPLLVPLPAPRSPRNEAECDRLREDNKNLVHGCLQRYFHRYAQDEEAIQAGRIGLWRASLKYDPTRLKSDGTPHKFSTYAYKCIYDHVAKELKSRRGSCIHVPPDSRYAEAAARAGRMADLSTVLDAAWPQRVDDDPTAAEVRLASAWGRDTMPESDRLLFQRRYYLCWSFMRIAAEMGISPARVKQRHKAALGRLRAATEYAKGLFDEVSD